jgi:hypothetical protein
LRRAEIAALTVGDLHQNRGYDTLRVMRKDGRRDALAINPQTAARLRAYLEAAGHSTDNDGPLFRPLRHSGKQDEARRHMDRTRSTAWSANTPGALGLDRGYSAHFMAYPPFDALPEPPRFESTGSMGTAAALVGPPSAADTITRYQSNRCQPA